MRIVMSKLLGRLGIAAAFLGSGQIVFGQAEALTLEQAIAMAKRRNGNVRAAVLDFQSAKSRVRQSFGSFLPTVTPSSSYQYSRSQTYTGSFQGITRIDEWQPAVVASWRLLDSGERDWSYRSSRRLAESSQSDALQTLRNTLFSVHQQYFDALRSQELLRVNDLQVQRAEKILDQTKAQIAAKAAPEKDLLQATADSLNARVSRLQAFNLVATSLASLKATIGWDPTAAVPDLAKQSEPSAFASIEALETVLAEGLLRRADLLSLRKRVEAQRFSVLLAERQALASWSLDASYSRQFGPETSDTRALTFLISIPLFDGFSSRESARQAQLSHESLKAILLQSEREARADIESAYKVLVQDIERVRAAKVAVDASRQNYEAAAEAQRLGAEGTTIITVLTAQVSLVTAESNYVEALYDYLISEVRLRLATGLPLPGENE